ncbi:CBF-domain-containing protein [Anaeromyces robustus]|uniref:CBF-domain-containing protein n=1 Tax=Anaeromyces robustus TaxID=1754192 RepID=A0A1Y1XAY9_9FUNG|nr:CBF-domain-containing protein [Anaeromyces robustus]|eukprot:ORX82922.1 CBF-domain-containing protein [Anaeromyces robustus]
MPPKKRNNNKNKNNNNKLQLIIKPTKIWYNVELEPLSEEKKKSVNYDLVQSQYLKAQKLFEEELTNYSERINSRNGGEHEFFKTVLQSGTLTDKVSAVSLMIQESPVHNFNLLKQNLFLNMVKKKNRRESIMAVNTMKDLLMNNILPERKLKYFKDQDVTNSSVTPKHLLLWYFEDSLKKLYFEFIQALEEMSHDNLDFVKNKAISSIFELLVAKPEQEKNLLTLLVNKLGDTNRKLASKASYLLSQLLLKHPNMKLVVIKEIEHLLFRTNISERAQYYAVIFLNQIILTRTKAGEEAANKLIEIYFVLFEKLCGKNTTKKGKKNKKKTNNSKINNGANITEIDSVNVKMMAALLTGVNRTFPFAKVEDEVFDKQINTLFTISHIGTFNISIQALMLIFQVSLSRQSISDRYYRSLYMTLLDHRLFSSSKHAMYLNLLYKSLREDNSLIRIKSFIKRILQVCTFHKVPFICGSLYLISEIIKQKPGLLVMITQPEENDSDEEEFKDVSEDEEESDSSEKENKVSEENNTKEIKSSKKYDGKKRDPLYTNVDNSCLWELTQFTSHYHPTVALYVQTLLSGKFIEFPKSINYDPLQNHTLSRFLDRFIYKNPKKVSNTYKGGSIMQPRKLVGNGLVSSMKKQNVILEQDDDDNLGKKKRIMMDDYAVNTQNFLKRDEKDIPVDELFFYKYFKEQSLHNKKKKSKDVNLDEDANDNEMELNDEEEDELEEEEIFKAMQNSSGFPDIGEDEDEDIEFDENDFLSDEGDENNEDIEEDDENDVEEQDKEDYENEIKIEGDEEESGEEEEETKEEISKDIMDLKEMFDLDDTQIKKSKKSNKKDNKDKKDNKKSKPKKDKKSEEVKIELGANDEGEWEDMDDDINWAEVGMGEEGEEGEGEDDNKLMNFAFGDDDINEGLDEDEEFEGIEAELNSSKNKNKKNKNKNKKTKGINKLEAAAKSLGYEGEYFKMGGGSFASAEDWEKLLDANELPSDNDDGEDDDISQNIKEIMKSFNQKGSKNRGNTTTTTTNNNKKRKSKTQNKKNKRVKK